MKKALNLFARQIMAQNLPQVEKAAAKYVGCQIPWPIQPEATAGAMDIIAEWISENEKGKKYSALTIYAQCHHLLSRNSKAEDPDGLYTNYYDFSQVTVAHMRPHRYLAMRRGETPGY